MNPYTEKTVSAYEPHEINALLAAAEREESEFIQFFLSREPAIRKFSFATWRDVNFVAKTFSITEKLDLAFTPKDKEEGDKPIPDSLVDPTGPFLKLPLQSAALTEALAAFSRTPRHSSPFGSFTPCSSFDPSRK